MNSNTLIMLAILIILAAVLLVRDGTDGLVAGVKAGLSTISNVWILLLIAIAIGGFLTVLVPTEMVSDYIGRDSGFRGLLIGWGVGAVLPGAPYTVLPIAASLLKTGAGIGPVMALVLSSSIGIALTRIPLELAFVGWRFSVLRLAASFTVPLVGGLIAFAVNKVLHFYQ